MWTTPLLPLLPGPLGSGVVEPDRVLSMGQIELNFNYAKLNCLKFIVFTFPDVKTKNYTYTKLNCLK